MKIPADNLLLLNIQNTVISKIPPTKNTSTPFKKGGENKNASTFFYKGDEGFTLIELLAVLAILAILLVLAIPSGQHLLIQNRTTTQINTLLGGLNYARFEAISRNEKLKFCKSANHETCRGRWRDGQILLDAKKNVLRVFSGLPKKDDLAWDSSSGLDDFLVWLPTGYTNSQRGTFYYCAGDHNVADSRGIVLLDTGRSYVSSMSAEDYETHCFK